MPSNFVDRRVTIQKTRVGTAGTNNIAWNLPNAEADKTEIRDLRSSLRNATAARGFISAFLFDKDTNQTFDILSNEVQSNIDVYSIGTMERNAISSDLTRPQIIFQFKNTVAADELRMRFSYTIRSYE